MTNTPETSVAELVKEARANVHSFQAYPAGLITRLADALERLIAQQGEAVAWRFTSQLNPGSWAFIDDKDKVKHIADAGLHVEALGVLPIAPAPDAGMWKALKQIAEFQNPETLSGAHLTKEGRGQLAFAMIDNAKRIAVAALVSAPQPAPPDDDLAKLGKATGAHPWT